MGKQRVDKIKKWGNMLTVEQAFDSIQNLTNAKISQAELCKVLNIKSSAMGNRQMRNSDFSTEEIQQINVHYNVDLFNNITQYVSIADDCTEIPVRGNVSASMGYGLTIYDETQTGTYAINKRRFLNIDKYTETIYY